MPDKQFLELISIVFGILLAVIVVVRTIVMITKHIVVSSTKFESAIKNLSESIEKLTDAMSDGMKELHTRVDKNDAAIHSLDIKVALIARELKIEVSE